MDSRLKKFRKVLIVATIDKHIESFHLPFIEELYKNGYLVDVASNGTATFPFVNQKFNIPFTRNPISKDNLKSYKQLKKIINDNVYDIIHCHTPVGGAVGRLAAKNSNSKVVYTAHGFHFYEGAPVKNWLVFYPIEKYLSKYTNLLITINKEDYVLAKNRFKKTRVKYVPGIGIDLDLIKENQKNTNFRKEIGAKIDDIVFLSVGELNFNKNHQLVIETLSKIKEKSFIYAIAGEGPLKQDLIECINDKGLNNKVKLLGYRNDVISIMKQSDIFLFPSKREGLPVSIMEAMSTNMIIIASDIRGNRDFKDYCSEQKFKLFKSNDSVDLLNKIEKTLEVFNNEEMKNVHHDCSLFSKERILAEMKSLYIELEEDYNI